MNADDALLAGGAGFTAAALAAGHWYHWYHDLSRLEAYSFGTAAILLGQGIYMRFNRRWVRLCLIAATGGAVVIAAYQHDRSRNAQINKRAAGGQRKRGILPTD